MGSRVVDGYREPKTGWKIVGVDDWLVYVRNTRSGLWGFFDVEIAPEWFDVHPRGYQSHSGPSDQMVYDVGVAVMRNDGRYLEERVRPVEAEYLADTKASFAPRPGDRKQRAPKETPQPPWRIVGRYK